jgi:arylsulfatase A-like enzyme
VLIVVSDHGEAFYEHGQPTHGTALFDEQVRSLWMMRVPGLPATRVAEPVSLLDVAPTLLGQLGLAPHGNFQGRSDVLDADYNGRKRPVFFTIQGLTQEDGVLLGGTKLILDWDRQTRALFDLDADPGETLDLAGERVDRRQALEQVLAAFLRQQLTYYEERHWTEGYYPARLP